MILEKKFGTKNVVVVDIISQIEKMKNITTDKGFIEFVALLEKIKLDLETLGQVSEIANAGYIGKIEAKIPIQISTDWWKIVTDKELEDKASGDKFNRLLTFLKKAKKRVEKQTCSLNQTFVGTTPGTKSVVHVAISSVSQPANQHPN